MRIVQEAIKPDASLAELARLAGADPGFSMRVLALVNSPAFRRSECEISSLQRAAAMLGLRGMRNLALSLAVTDMAPRGLPGQVLLANALRRALAARGIAAVTGEKEPDSYFTAGLFIEAGMLVHAAADLDRAGSIAGAPAAHRMVREQAHGWERHPDVGAELAASYKLPDVVVEAIRCHHDESAPQSVVARVCWLAERVAAVFEGGHVDDALCAAHAAAMEIGVSRAHLEEVLEALPAQVSEVASSMERSVGDQPSLEALAEDANRALVDLNQQYEHLVSALQAVIAEKEKLAEQLHAANKELERTAHTDALTGLPNKRALETFLKQTLARSERDGSAISLVMIDVDHFKKFNDTWGHATGDEVLRVVGGVLAKSVRAADLPARYGGEEFALILPTADEAAANVVAERVRKAIEGTSILGPEGPLSVTVSLGIATVVGAEARSGRDPLFERADAALYESKRAGRNRVTTAPR